MLPVFFKPSVWLFQVLILDFFLINRIRSDLIQEWNNDVTVSGAAVPVASLSRDRKAGILHGWSKHRTGPASLLHPWVLLG